MLDHHIVSLDQPDVWDQLVCQVPHCIGHTHAYCNAIAKHMGLPVFLYVCRSDNGLLICPYAMRIFRDTKDIVSIYGNGGFVGKGDFANFQSEWSAFLLEQGVTTAFIALNQVYDWGHLFDQSVLYFNKNTYLVNLELSLDTLYKNMGRNNRRLIKKWHQAGHSLFRDQEQLHQRFLSLYPKFSTQMNTDEKYQFDSDVLNMLYKNSNIYYNGVIEGRNITAIRCFLYEGLVADAFLEAHEPGVKQHSRALYLDGICYLKEHNIAKLNLSGGIQSGDSIEFFKSQMGGDKRAHHVVKLVVNASKYQELCESIPEKNAYFPAYYSQT